MLFFCFSLFQTRYDGAAKYDNDFLNNITKQKLCTVYKVYRVAQSNTGVSYSTLSYWYVYSKLLFNQLNVNLDECVNCNSALSFLYYLYHSLDPQK